jgi:hypothetical protein
VAGHPNDAGMKAISDAVSRLLLYNNSTSDESYSFQSSGRAPRSYRNGDLCGGLDSNITNLACEGRVLNKYTASILGT